MKKTILILTLLAGITASTFATTFSIGGNLNGGGTLSNNNQFNGLSSGAGVFVNMDMFLGLGLQMEANYTTQKVTFKNNSVTFTEQCGIIDLPVMLWWNGFFGLFGFGGGVGLNIGFTDFDNDDSKYSIGASAGTNAILYITPDIGLVFGTHGVFDFTPFVSVTSNEEEKSTTYTFDFHNWKRKSIYGNIGVMVRF